MLQSNKEFRLKDFLGQPLEINDRVVFVDTAHIETMKHAKIVGFIEYEAGWFAKLKHMYMYGCLMGNTEHPCRYMIKIDPELSKVKR